MKIFFREMNVDDWDKIGKVKEKRREREKWWEKLSVRRYVIKILGNLAKRG